jgi:hypothetical protein
MAGGVLSGGTACLGLLGSMIAGYTIGLMGPGYIGIRIINNDLHKLELELQENNIVQENKITLTSEMLIQSIQEQLQKFNQAHDEVSLKVQDELNSLWSGYLTLGWSDVKYMGILVEEAHAHLNFFNTEIEYTRRYMHELEMLCLAMKASKNR